MTNARRESIDRTRVACATDLQTSPRIRDIFLGLENGLAHARRTGAGPHAQPGRLGLGTCGARCSVTPRPEAALRCTAAPRAQRLTRPEENIHHLTYFIWRRARPGPASGLFGSLGLPAPRRSDRFANDGFIFPLTESATALPAGLNSLSRLHRVRRGFDCEANCSSLT